MKMICLGSGSSGNCYVFKASNGTLLVEVGIAINEIKKGLNWKLGDIAGVIVSHRHNDHALSVKNLAELGIPVYALDDVLESHCIQDNHFCHTIEPMHGYKIGSFKVYAFDVAHDVPCVGFIIEHPEMGKLMFATDTMMIEYKFKGLNHIMIEANYSDKILDYNIEQGYINPAMKERLMGSHMELETTKGVLAANDLSRVRDIVLIHLSGNNSNGQEFKDEVERATGIPTYIAKKDFTIDLTI